MIRDYGLLNTESSDLISHFRFLLGPLLCETFEGCPSGPDAVTERKLPARKGSSELVHGNSRPRYRE